VIEPINGSSPDQPISEYLVSAIFNFIEGARPASFVQNSIREAIFHIKFFAKFPRFLRKFAIMRQALQSYPPHTKGSSLVQNTIVCSQMLALLWVCCVGSII